MSYMDIENLYKAQEVLQFKQVWTTEKIHGTSANITYNPNESKLIFFSGGAPYDSFVEQFKDIQDDIYKKLQESFGSKKVIIYGEHYGGKIMKMSDTYGKQQRFVVFEIKVDDCWLSFDKVQMVAARLGLDIVPCRIIECSIENLDAERDRPSEQAVKNGIIEPKMREGIVIRPLIECALNNGNRIIAKHKSDKFKETATPREVVSTERQKVLTDADNIAFEWVTEMRLTHVLDKLGNPNDIKDTGKVIKAMNEDVIKESKGEIVMSLEASKAIGRRTAELYQNRLRENLKENTVDFECSKSNNKAKTTVMV